jgi:Xaa-Pro aminopeptidase
MSRIEILSAKLNRGEAIILLRPENRRYFTGMTTSNGLLLVTPDQAWFFTDFRYIIAAKQIVNKPIAVELFNGTHAATLKKTLETLPYKTERIYFEDTYLSFSSAKAFMEEMKDIDFAGGESLVSVLRREKTQHEINLISEAQKITDDAFTDILDYISMNKDKGITEKDIAFELEFDMRRRGAISLAFDTIIASGTNGACCHAVPSDKQVKSGELITMDFGACFEGYMSDMTRTVAIGNISEDKEKIYDIVLNAQLTAIKNIKAGMTGSQCDAFARDYIAKEGYGKDFGHSLGHGVGLEIHEGPNFAQSFSGIINVNAVMSVEPGIYIEDNCGVRIEDLVVVKEDGVDILTKSPKQLIRL